MKCGMVSMTTTKTAAPHNTLRNFADDHLEANIPASL